MGGGGGGGGGGQRGKGVGRATADDVGEFAEVQSM